MKRSQFVSSNTHIVLLILKYFLLKNRLYNPATHKFPINDAKNHETINNSGKIGFVAVVDFTSVIDPQIAVKIMNSNPDIMSHTMIPINTLPKISHHDDWFGFAVNSVLKSVILIFK